MAGTLAEGALTALTSIWRRERGQGGQDVGRLDAQEAGVGTGGVGVALVAGPQGDMAGVPGRRAPASG
jgi:hypothetical protein